MAITAAVCDSFKLEAADGIHLAADVYKCAVYSNAAALGAATTVYSATDEVPNSGTYVAGGITLVGRVSVLASGVAIIDWTTDPLWTGATIAGRGALIYNSSRANKACAVLDFGGIITSTNGNFLITLPAATNLLATIRLG